MYADGDNLPNVGNASQSSAKECLNGKQALGRCDGLCSGVGALSLHDGDDGRKEQSCGGYENS